MCGVCVYHVGVANPTQKPKASRQSVFPLLPCNQNCLRRQLHSAKLGAWQTTNYH